MFGEINYLAVLVAAIVQMAIGAVWYSPALFGKKWMGYMFAGKSQDEVKAHMKGAGLSYFWGFVTALILNFVLANMFFFSGVGTLTEGLVTAFWLWLGFMFTVQIGAVLWEKKPAGFFWLNTLYSLVAILVSAVVLVQIF